MAIGTENAFSGPYEANGVTTEFPFDFSVLTESQVAVVLIDADGAETTADPSLYTVELNGTAPTDGTVTFLSAPADGLQVVPVLDMPFTQETQFVDGSAWKASPTNNVNDRAALRDQQLRRDLDRSIKVPFGETGLKLPPVATRAGGYVAFDADGDIVPASGTGADADLRTDLAAADGYTLIGGLEDQLDGLGTTVSSTASTTYTFVLTDKIKRFTAATAVTAVIPNESLTDFPIGTYIECHQVGAGAITFSAAVGVTVTSRGGLYETAGQYAVAGIRKMASNSWQLVGDLV